MSSNMHAVVVPHSSAVGTSITLHVTPGGEVFAQLSLLTPAGPPLGVDAKQFQERIARAVADAINNRTALETHRMKLKPILTQQKGE